MRPVPLLATVLVLAAVVTMIGLGLWQLGRLREKEALLAYYARAGANPAEVGFPIAKAGKALLYRHARLTCEQVTSASFIAGRNLKGESGLARLVRCTARGGEADVVLGWSRAPTAANWTGGEVTGIIAPGGVNGVKLVADPPLAGLAPNARPDPREIPNNHLSYAVQWFLFATTAMVIYLLALRARWRRGA
jgi:surfeit locus 1 family protein